MKIHVNIEHRPGPLQLGNIANFLCVYLQRKRNFGVSNLATLVSFGLFAEWKVEGT